jgi:hypothetical protein
MLLLKTISLLIGVKNIKIYLKSFMDEPISVSCNQIKENMNMTYNIMMRKLSCLHFQKFLI